MKKEILNGEKLDILRKQRNKIIIVSLCFFFLVLGYLIGSIFIQTRDTMKIFVIINSLITILGLFFLFAYLTQVIIPLNKAIKVISIALKNNKTIEKYVIDNIQDKNETYLGVVCNVINVSNGTRKLKLFYPLDEKVDLDINKEYEFEYYHNFVISIKEVMEDD
jgi:hypothetical protein